MASFNAILTLNRQHPGADLADEVHGTDLDAFHAVTGVDQRGRAQIIITITADDLGQAAATARALLARFPDQVRFEVMTAEEYDRADVPIPQLRSVTETADRLGITRQGVLDKITRGQLPARKVGNTWVIAG